MSELDINNNLSILNTNQELNRKRKSIMYKRLR